MFVFATLHFVSALLIKDKQTGQPKGFGFVTYENPADAEDAIAAMNGKVQPVDTFEHIIVQVRPRERTFKTRITHKEQKIYFI